MTRQESFEQHYADQHDLPVETMAQYRWAEQDGYRLPGIAAAYRNYCAGWDASPVQLWWVTEPGNGLIRCVPDAKYRKFSPSIRARYTPVLHRQDQGIQQ